jgi:formylglycine-generating enzyme required for sulfatase activity
MSAMTTVMVLSAPFANGTTPDWEWLRCTYGLSAPSLQAEVIPARPAGEMAVFAGIDFVWCPPGSFIMGTKDEVPRRGWEKPQHKVKLTRGFWMARTEITQAQWSAIMPLNRSYFSDNLNNPCEMVSWNDITGPEGYLERLNAANPDQHFRLPTEAEWEYACRAGTDTEFYWGDDPSAIGAPDYAWYGNISDKKPHPVGLKRPNAWGLCDIAGNVSEWCQDWHGQYEAADATDPAGPSTGTRKIHRGGGWGSLVSNCRSAHRMGDPPDGSIEIIGFRIVKEE